MGIKKIMCCCGSGLGSSLMIRLNVEKALKKLGISGVEVCIHLYQMHQLTQQICLL